MSFQAYIDNVSAKTGKSPEDFKKLAAKQGLAKFGEVLAWLKAEFGLGHGHATAIAHLVVNADAPKVSAATKLDNHFAGKKAAWRKPFDELSQLLRKFGDDVALSPNKTYINLQKGAKKFAILQIASAERIDVGIKLKGVEATDRFEPAAAWNAMVTHRVRIHSPQEINAELIKWLKKAYEAV
jgi:hypothetical protein